MNKRFLNIILMLTVLVSSLFAGTTGGYAGSYLRMGLGARAMSMGNTGVATVSDGYSSYYNPALIANISKKHAAVSYSFLTLDREFHYAGIAMPVKPSAGIGVSWIHAGVSDVQGRTSTGRLDDVYSPGEDAIYFSFSNHFHKKFLAGVNLKILQHNLVENKGTGVGIDLGFLFMPVKSLSLGFVITDALSSYTWNTEEWFDDEGTNYQETFPLVLKTGVAFVQEKFKISADLEYSDELDFIYHAGCEWNPLKPVALRFGLNNGLPTLGAGLFYNSGSNLDTQLDYCFVFDKVGEGVTNVFSWQFIF